MIRRISAALLSFALLAACEAPVTDLDGPPVPLGDFVLGHNIVITKNMVKSPVSREATQQEWETALEGAIAQRFDRYNGTKIINLGVHLDGYALAPPGVPIVASPKSVLIVTVHVFDDAKQQKLGDPKGKQLTVFESRSGDSVVGSGLTKTKAQQMEMLSRNAAKQIEGWLLENPEWLGMTEAQAAASRAMARSGARPAAAKPAATASVGPPDER